eukprot:12255664-Prorocentrum_lima.AAC.1
MKVSKSELQQIHSTNLTFSAVTGSIYVYDTVITDTTYIRDRITMMALNDLVFAASTVFKSIRAVALKLNISADMK